MFKMSSWGTKAHQFDKDDIKLQKMHELLKLYKIEEQEKEKIEKTKAVLVYRMQEVKKEMA